MGLKCGIVGLPNVGKSTLFNAVTQTESAEAANYPFCTIDPNIGIVDVPDSRLYKIAEIAGSGKIIPTQIEFVDIAGLVRGASKGEGLGNKFLSHIREVDAIVHLLRCFENDDITHVEGDVDPIRDAEVIELELALADLESLTKRVPSLEKKAKTNKEIAAELELIKLCIAALEQGKPASSVRNEFNSRQLDLLQLLTTKPILYVCNVDESEVQSGNDLARKVIEKAHSEGKEAIWISAKIESEIALLDSAEERQEFLQSIGLQETGLSKLITASYKLLGLITYFTAGPKEARAWDVRLGASAPQAAGVIHTDFEKGFIKAETIAYSDYLAFKGEVGAKEAGKLRLEGKEYIVKDGDVMHFKFNV